MVFVAKSVTGGDVLDADDRGDVTRVTGLNVFALVRLNLNQTRDALALIRARIVNIVTFAQRPGVNAKENEFPDEWIAPEFEGERAEISVVVRRCIHWLMRIGLHPFGWRNIERTRQIV